MNIDEQFPSKWIKADDLQGRSVTVTIDRVELDQMTDGEKKPIVYFRGKQKGLVLNKTNANNIKKLYGAQTEGWSGKQIVLFTAWVDFRGETVEAVRVRGPEGGGTFITNDPDRPIGGMGSQFDEHPNAPDQDAGARIDDEVPFAPDRS